MEKKNEENNQIDEQDFKFPTRVLGFPGKTITGYTCRERTGTRGAHKSILIADDNVTNLSLLVSALEPLGFEIETAENGEEAVGKAAETSPDLILMDLLMPVLREFWTDWKQRMRNMAVFAAG